MAKYNAAELGRVRLNIIVPMSVHSDAEDARVVDLNDYTRRETSSG
jgi:hypothetical protein